MNLSDDVKDSIDDCVLCWLATVSADGEPNVSPKEVFCSYGDTEILIANIASPQTLRNIRQTGRACCSFVDVFTQKGYQLHAHAEVLDASMPAYTARAVRLERITEGKFPFDTLFRLKVERVKPIVAPRYHFYPETTEQSQIESAMRAYGVVPASAAVGASADAQGEVGDFDATCYRCGYSRYGLAQDHRCPECGTLPPPPDVKYPCPECGHEWTDRAIVGCDNCGHKLPPGEAFTWGTALQRPSATGERAKLAGSLVMISSIPVGIIGSFFDPVLIILPVIALFGIGLIIRGVADHLGSRRFLTPAAGTSQLRLSRRGFATRTGPGPVTWIPWQQHWQVQVSRRKLHDGHVVTVQSPLFGPLVWDEPLKFRPLGGEETAHRLHDDIERCLDAVRSNPEVEADSAGI